MNLSARLYIPGLPDRWTPVLAVLMLVSMLLGLNLRKAFPFVSVFAWGIPSAMIVSVIVQLIVYRLAQAKKVAEIEKANGRALHVVAYAMVWEWRRSVPACPNCTVNKSRNF